jgi:hypothetical protein
MQLPLLLLLVEFGCGSCLLLLLLEAWWVNLTCCATALCLLVTSQSAALDLLLLSTVHFHSPNRQLNMSAVRLLWQRFSCCLRPCCCWPTAVTCALRETC